jgi:hypothetical protein
MLCGMYVGLVHTLKNAKRICEGSAFLINKFWPPERSGFPHVFSTALLGKNFCGAPVQNKQTKRGADQTEG